MNHISVSSSTVRSIGYENGVLEVIFKNGLIFQWDVPESIYREFMSAPSKGTFVHSRLKGRYGERRV
jgi:hypothetical protein